MRGSGKGSDMHGDAELFAQAQVLSHPSHQARAFWLWGVQQQREIQEVMLLVLGEHLGDHLIDS